MQDWLNDPDYAVIFCLGSSSFWVYANRISDFTGFTYTNNVSNQCLQFSSPGYYFYFSYSSGWSLSIFNTNDRSNSVTSLGNPFIALLSLWFPMSVIRGHLISCLTFILLL